MAQSDQVRDTHTLRPSDLHAGHDANPDAAIGRLTGAVLALQSASRVNAERLERLEEKLDIVLEGALSAPAPMARAARGILGLRSLAPAAKDSGRIALIVGILKAIELYVVPLLQ